MSKTYFDKVKEDYHSFGLQLLPTDRQDSFRHFSRAIPIKIQNVAEYFFETPKSDWSAADFPNVAPPFDSFWMEYVMPPRVNVDGVIEHNLAARNRVGIWFWSEETTEDKRRGWLLNCWLFVSRWEGETAQQIARAFIGVDENGAIDGDSFGINRPDVPEMFNMAAWFNPGFLALSFLHCKNVEMIDNAPSDLPITKKRMQHSPRTKFYTLNIHSVRRILEDEGNASKTGLKLALHICRGHFKDYSNGGGLFGKNKGLYWWDSQVRGNKQYGEVKKDYNVKPN